MRDDIMSTELLPNLKHMLAGNDTGLKVSTLWVINNLTYRCAGMSLRFTRGCSAQSGCQPGPAPPFQRAAVCNICVFTCLALPNPKFPAVVAVYTTAQMWSAVRCGALLGWCRQWHRHIKFSCQDISD